MLTRTKILSQVKWASIFWFIGLMLVVTILPHYIHNQWITGPIVNAVLFVVAVQLGVGNAILIGLVPSVVALASGLLPAPLAPMVPFIMISNAILIVAFAFFRKVNYWTGVFGGTIFKYAFLYLISTIVINLITNHSIATKAAATMLAWPQIVTAIVGGIIAFGVLRITKNGNE